VLLVLIEKRLSDWHIKARFLIKAIGTALDWNSAEAAVIPGSIFKLSTTIPSSSIQAPESIIVAHITIRRT
jgi:hypothetical protein